MRKPLIIANWKMNHTVNEALKFLTVLQKQPNLPSDIDMVICPPFTCLQSLSILLAEEKKVSLGAQNVHWEKAGAYTGEVSPLFLKELGCDYVIVGHSERRQLFFETNEMISKKVKAVLENEMIPIFCIGETKQERDQGKTQMVIQTQLRSALDFLPHNFFSHLVIAYEPVWAIGTGQNATPEVAEEVHHYIREWVSKKVGGEIAGQIRIVYGGSVKPDNCAELLKKPDIDGVLVGGASVSVDSFLQIVNYRR